MDNSRKLKLNVIFNTLFEILAIITPFITAPYASRILNSDGIGIYSYTLSLATYFSMVAMLGVTTYGCREIARNRDDKKKCSKSFWEIQIVIIIISAFCCSIWVIFSFSYLEYKKYMLILTLNIFASMFNVSWFFAGLEKFKYNISINAVIKILTIISIFLFVKTKEDLGIYILIYSIGLLGGNLSIWIFLPKYLSKTKLSIKSMFAHFIKLIIYFVPAIATTIYTVLDKSLIGIITKDDNENGYYEQATKIINIIKTACILGINGVMISRANFLFSINEKDEAKRLGNTALNITSLLSIGAMFGLLAISKYFVPVFFGEGYDPVIKILYIFSPIILIICLSNCLYQLYFLPAGKINKATICLLIGALVNVLLNIPLIIIFKSFGAAIASVIAELIIMILLFFICDQFITVKEVFLCIWKKLLSGLIMWLFLFILNMFLFEKVFNNITILFFDIFLGIVIYFICLICLKDDAVKSTITYIKSKFKIKKNEQNK